MYYNNRAARDNMLIISMLTFGYFIIEIVINYNIYNQLSYSSSLMAIESLEFWGKIVTGIGLSLVITRLTVVSPAMLERDAGLASRIKNPLKTFFCLCAICIPLSFFLQNKIINSIVESSTPDQQNRALLASTVQKTIVPHYDFSNTSSPEVIDPLLPHQKFMYPVSSKPNSSFNSADDDYYKYKRHYDAAVKKCVPASRDALGMQSSLDRAFFAYSALDTVPEKAEVYKVAITDHYECLLSTPAFQDTHTNNVPYNKSVIVDMYNSYFVPGLAEWKYGAGYSRAAADKAWRKRANQLFGFKTTIKPYANMGADERFDYFTTHRDVRRFYNENTGPDAKDLYPFDEGFNERKTAFIVSKLPQALIPTYLNYTPSASSDTGYELADKPLEASTPPAPNEGDYEVVGKAAYKAVVMPMVAMALSAFFLIFNIIVFTFSVVKRRSSTKVAVTYLCLILGLTAALPLTPLSNGINSNPLMRDQSFKVKWLYNQESILGKAYRLIRSNDD